VEEPSARRHEVDLIVSLRAGGWRGPARIRNVSVTGADLQCAVPVKYPGARIWLELSTGRESVGLSAYVVRGTADGISVQWSELASEAVVHLLGRPLPPGAQARALPAEFRVRRELEALRAILQQLNAEADGKRQSDSG